MSNRTTEFIQKVNEQIAELRKPLSPISRLTDEQLENLENNYRRANKLTGGRWSFEEVLQEKQRRTADERDPYSVLKVIVQYCRRSPDSRITYLELWRAIRPGQRWNAYSSLRAIMSAMERVILYCIIYDLPIVTALVVPSSSRQLSDNAVGNIFKVCRAHRCVAPGLNASRFVTQQIVQSRELIAAAK